MAAIKIARIVNPPKVDEWLVHTNNVLEVMVSMGRQKVTMVAYIFRVVIKC